MSVEIKHINDYKIIIPENQQDLGIDFRIVVKNHFNNKIILDNGEVFEPNYCDLILCLVEMVTLRNITAIGEKFLYSTLNERKSEEFFKKYENLVNEVINKFSSKLSEIGIVGFKEWYSLNSFIITKTNQVEYLIRSFPDWIQSHNHSRDERKSEEYGKIIQSDLDIKDINEFLEFYAEKLESDLGFSNYPAYCIIVRPIGFKKSDEIVPLGNIFLHFATKKEYPEKFYLEFINKFLIVWFKNKGVEIYSEVYEKVKDEIKNKVKKTYLPNFNHLKNPSRLSENLKANKKTIYNFSLETYFDKYFDDKSDCFINKCKEIATYLIQKIKKNEPINEAEYLIILGKDSSFFKLSGIDLLIPTFNIDVFEDVLLKREIFKMGFIVCEKSPQAMLYFIKNGEFKENQHYPLKYNIWTQLFIPWANDKYEKKDFNKYTKCIEDSLSKVENDLLLYYKSLI